MFRIFFQRSIQIYNTIQRVSNNHKNIRLTMMRNLRIQNNIYLKAIFLEIVSFRLAMFEIIISKTM